MTEGRDYQRILYRKRVFFGIEKPEYIGFTEDVSLSGIHLSSETPIPVGTKLVIGFGTLKSEPKVKVKGQSVWMVPPDPKDSHNPFFHAGIKLTWHDDDYLQLLATLIQEKRMQRVMQKEQRGFVRYDRKVEVIFENEGEILQQLTQNISKGGLFVSTDKPIPKGTMVNLRIVIPHIMEDIQAQGEVAFTLDLNEAQQRMHPPGMGIKFVNFAEGDQDKFLGFLKKIAAAARATGSLPGK